ncbi:DUF4232 domain-containing protein [Streptomyces sp. A012304]|uniref:DUF4232 domain-containing protein n=1 Tax=Streptomyces sp. A012304 TaxID=375446 RepID=UPI00222FE9E3|nr:DUF4232 domain-containing protein [Streptomyces sp. A012304]GKQ38380.1 lipoprotein [Streptomyces sp. A012304]
MRRATPLLPALAACLLLAACGSERSGTPDSGPGTAGPPPRTQVTDPGVDGVRITSMTVPTASPSPSRGLGVHADSLPRGPVDPVVSAEYEVTNTGTEALTYTIVFTFSSSAGEAMSHQRETVGAVGAGKTVRGTVALAELPPGASPVTRVKITEVTKVPSDEAPAGTGDCPPSGIRVTADEGDAAMGLRVVGLHLENCGKRDYSVEGYPQLELLDDEHQPVDGVRILQGSGAVSSAAGPDEPPRPVTLKPGEKATSTLVWRNTTQSGTPVDVPYVRVRAKAGADPFMVTPHLDLGTTGQLGVRPWQRAVE